MLEHGAEVPKYFNHHYHPANPAQRIVIPLEGKGIASNGVDHHLIGEAVIRPSRSILL
jgi:hypothetical protein